MTAAMTELLLLAVTFAAGAAYECACVFWLHYAQRGQRAPATAWSCFAALVTVLGVEGFLRSPLFVAVYVLGYGTGTWFAIGVKERIIARIAPADLRDGDA